MTRAEEFSKRQKGNNIMGLPELGGHPRDSTLVGRRGHGIRCAAPRMASLGEQSWSSGPQNRSISQEKGL